MKDYLLKTKLFAWAYRQGGIDAFPLAQKDILETMRDDLDAQAEELANRKLATLLSIVDEKLIVSASKTGTLLIGGERPDDARLANLKEDAEFLMQSDIWKLLYETPKALAEKAMFVDDGKLDTQLLKGRAILYTLATQKKIIGIFSKLSTGK
jgi:hypothetical protein